MTFVAATLVLSAFATAQIPAVHYVDWSATGSASGLSWADAFTSLDAALTATPPAGQIWVAEGTYAPSIPLNPSDPNSITFLVPPQTEIYGGFLGYETAVSLRAGSFDATILEGNAASALAYHVVTTYGTVKIDGFQIHGGYANGLGENSRGGGIYCTVSSNGQAAALTLNNCLIQENYAGGRGGGLFQNLGSLQMKRCTFRDNFATDGGAISIQSSSLVAHNLECVENRAVNAGGAVHAVSTTSVSFANGLFRSNFANDGGALHLPAGTYTSSSAVLKNCTVTGNTAYLSGGGIFAGTSTMVSSSSLHNSIVWGNLASIGAELFGTHYASYSDVPISGTGCVYADPLFGPTYGATYDFEPTSTSVVDAGSNALLPADVTDLDRDGNTAEALPRDFYNDVRIKNSVVDMGCAEL